MTTSSPSSSLIVRARGPLPPAHASAPPHADRALPLLTPSAARGMLEAIYHKPEFRYRIDRIGLMEAAANEQQYLIAFHLVTRPHASKSAEHYSALLRERLTSGASFKQPTFGTNHAPATVTLATGDEQPARVSRDYGWVRLDNAFIPNERGAYTFRHPVTGGVVRGDRKEVRFRAVARDGWVDVPQEKYDRIDALEALPIARPDSSERAKEAHGRDRNNPSHQEKEKGS
jgi:CRISPR-associated protein Cas5d